MKARDDVRDEGELTDAVMARLAKVLGGRPGLADALQKAREDLPENAAGMSAEEIKAKRQLQVLEVLNDYVNSCEGTLLRIAEDERRKAQVQRDASLLPGRKIVDRILKYESTLERQFYRAMNQLERLQRMRRGEVVPPPMVVQVS